MLKLLQRREPVFIEKLKEEDFDVFAYNFDCSVAVLEKLRDNKVYVKFFNNSNEQKPELILSDFECNINSKYEVISECVEYAWRKFLFEKFGKAYKKALKKELLNQVKELSK